jgi:hypothetical protein
MNCPRCNVAVMYSFSPRHEFHGYDPDEEVVFEHGTTGRSISRHRCYECKLTVETFIPLRIIDPEVET